MPFGIKKGDKPKEDAALAEKKSSLFSKKSKSPAPSGANPYAVPPPSSDPYAQQSQQQRNPYATQNGANDPYAPRSQSSLTQPPTSSFGSLTLNSEQGGPPAYGHSSPAASRYEKSPVPAGGYGGGAPRYQSQGSYGQSNGYGSSNPYGNENGPSQTQSRYGPSGYGGLGRSNSQDTMATDVGRQALFGDAPKRAQNAQQEEAAAAEQQPDGSYANAGGHDSSQTSGSYGYGADRELTEEEIENEQVNASKSMIKETKKQTVQTSRNAVRIAEQSEQIGRDTLARLGAQGDRIHNAETNLDLTSFQNQRATDKARELKTLNRSMFAVHVDNPFNKSARYERAIEGELQKRQHERQTLEQTRAAAYSSQQRKEGYQKDLRGNMVGNAGKQRNLADRSKYQFEADSEDDEMENEIEDNLDIIHRSAKTLNQLGKAMGEEIDSQNKHIDRISQKTDKVDDQIAMNRARLDRIK